MWEEVDTGHIRLDNPLGIRVSISPRDTEGETWRYRVAGELFTATGETKLDDVKACALGVLRLKLHSLLAEINLIR